MIHITSLDDGVELFKALGSDVRIQILNILLENDRMSMNQLATQLNLSNGALTGHIKKLEECGLISTSNESASHGNSKLCSVIQDKIVIEIEKPLDLANVSTTDIKVGQFSKYDICPTCGLANSASVIGEIDDARYFAHPDHFNADILWFTKGYVEYALPNLVPSNNNITQISISFEISSEAPGIDNNWPSDISFSINDQKVGMWTSPGDFGGEILGMFTPDWWPPNWNQYGLLKLLVVNKFGTFIDGLQISDITIDDLKLKPGQPLDFRIAVEDDAEHIGGVTLFGKTFGNYGQDIRVSINYSPIN
ncbi:MULTISPECIES: ArsR/SmtB family transcription factor [unclassified Pseudobutyrivibrio]|uniref:ArsR/SmtB family transcription factor n=1 Tax=unclassified Pseudobutyrivibrio TaxID=2638619 RepID=UPI0005D1CC5A|nr:MULTISPECIES: winged helix-turn-helix transcriptional regulator [unclassified Pseudobutyrivibrio]SFO25798.1 Predicted transcriptional regulator [Pseudobutyrivibrio sp. JW11]